MVENFQLCGVTDKRNCVTIHSDFLKLSDQDARVKGCNMAVVDPSCSGGGDFDHTVRAVMTS